jgi:dual specificity tyrosine-phosphorylation-regulated kinase 2/3/4
MRHPAVASKKPSLLIKIQAKPHKPSIKLPELSSVPLSSRIPSTPNLSPDSRPPNASLFDGPVKPSHIIVNFPEYLMDREASEIAQFREVWFLRNTVPKTKKTSNVIPDFFHFVPNDHIAYRYEQEAVIGKGSFGSVIRCLDHKTGERVAIKMLRDRPKVHSQILFELDLLIQLQGVDANEDHTIIRYFDSFSFRGFFCIVMELLYLDVYTVLKSQRFIGYPTNTVRMVGRETAAALSFIHQQGIIHCDIKPENILFTSKQKGHIKVIDFGCSCFIGKILFSYIQSRYYRAPEVVLGLEYGKEIDIWSLGCVLCEMFTGVPLFAADDEGELINMVVEMKGLPPLSLVKMAPRAHHYFDEAGRLKQKPNGKSKQIVPGSTPLGDATKLRDPMFLSLIESCLTWEPATRITAEELLTHPWIAQGEMEEKVALSAR